MRGNPARDSLLSNCQKVHEEFEKNNINCARFFFAGVYESCGNGAVLSLAKLMEQGKDSITLDTLLKSTTATREIFVLATPDMVMELAKRHQEFITELQPVIGDAKTQRDWTIAHLDKKHINQPDEINSHDINMVALEKSFDKLAELINAYRINLNLGGYSFEPLKEEINQDIAYLMSTMKKGSE